VARRWRRQQRRRAARRPACGPSSGDFSAGPGCPGLLRPSLIVSSGAGGVLDDRGEDEPPDGGRWIGYSVIHVSFEVASVETLNRSLSVSWHGYVLAIWCGLLAAST
jgi:hypothetical protein